MFSPITFKVSPKASSGQPSSDVSCSQKHGCLQPLEKDTVSFTGKYDALAKQISQNVKPATGLSLSGIIDTSRKFFLHGSQPKVPLLRVDANARALDPLILGLKALK